MPVDLSDPEAIRITALRELAQSILERIAHAPQPSRRNLVAGVLHVLDSPGMTALPRAIPPDERTAVERALAEGWDYLERHGLVSREPLQDQGYFVTRRGRAVLAGALAFPDEEHAGPPLS